MLLMEYPSVRGEEIPDYDKKKTWNLLHAYIDVHSQRLIDEYPLYAIYGNYRVIILFSPW